mmetsp:Transcript_4902/g.11538  ORF Transcript_4902/g.11538 Transcript_4902/m.11538 type:complete len:271 (-) Transcript_4902:131-943(-)
MEALIAMARRRDKKETKATRVGEDEAKAQEAAAKAANETLSLDEFVEIMKNARLLNASQTRAIFNASQKNEEPREITLDRKLAKNQAAALRALAKAQRALEKLGGGQEKGGSVVSTKSSASSSGEELSQVLDNSLERSFATEGSARVKQVLGGGYDDPFAILRKGLEDGEDGSKDGNLQQMDFAEFLEALVRVAATSTFRKEPGVPLYDKVGRVLKAVAELQGKPRSFADAAATRNKAQALGISTLGRRPGMGASPVFAKHMKAKKSIYH